MISKSIINFSKYFVLSYKNSPLDPNLMEDFVNNDYFENLLINLTEIDPYDFKISD